MNNTQKRRKRSLFVSLISMAIMAQSTIIVGAAAPASAVSANSPLGQVQGLDSEDRSKLYAGMTFNTGDWRIGTVVSREPYAVVTAFDENGPILRVWTGVLVREQNDLQTYWDQLRVGAGGKVLLQSTNLDSTIQGYFANSQEMYRTKAYLGKFPWADIPTDPEAEQSGSPKVASDIALNIYGIVTADKSIVMTDSLGSIKKEADIPAVVPSFRKFKEITLMEQPVDGTTHWARDEIMDLMKKSIIEGYEDHTIRPDRTLTKAEFVTLLVKTLGIDSAQAAATGYIDVDDNHWSRPAITAAQNFGLLPKAPAVHKLEPDAAISRLEMIDLLGRILQVYGGARVQAADAASFNDIGSMTEADIASLQAVVGAGIAQGYPDGSFKPKGALTRAEAFKVVSKLIHHLS